jgi:ABC-type branched-subunit amino acid transport system substrate-binding protein
MKSKIFLLLFYILFIFNTNLLSDENNKILKVGLLAPLTGPFSEIGNSLLYSLQLALEEINDKNVIVIPMDSGFNNDEKINFAINELKKSDVKIIIGPLTNEEFNQAKKHNDVIFISPSNINPDLTKNIISIGISLESQLLALITFIKKQKKTKTVIMYPDNKYAELIEKKLEKLNLKNLKTFKYSANPEILTGEIETLTNYTQRKRNLELRKKMFEDKDDEQSKKELEQLEQLYTLGNVNFDSVIIIDFGNSLKSVLTSLVYTDVNQDNVLFTTVNQWFDESIFYENTIKNIFYPSVNYKEYKKYNVKYYEKFKIYPNEITILAYDALGLIYFAWKKNGKITSINDFLFKNKIKGKIGTFSFKDGKVIQELDIYKTENKKFIKF